MVVPLDQTPSRAAVAWQSVAIITALARPDEPIPAEGRALGTHPGQTIAVADAADIAQPTLAHIGACVVEPIAAVGIALGTRRE